VEALADGPVISLVMPTYETDPRYLKKAIGSVREQSYPRWELRIVDDGSQSRSTRRTIERAVSRDPRIAARMLERNEGISAASNKGLELCGGELVAFLDHDDALAPDALLSVARAFAEHGFDVAYSDQDKITAGGEATDPFLKPDWSPIYALGAMYVGHLLVARREVVMDAGGFDPAFDSIQDFELLLRISEQTPRVHHIPETLYHWRAIPGSIALGETEKEGVTRLQARAVDAHLRRRGIDAHASPHPSVPHRVRLKPTPGGERPRVSVVIPARRAGARAATSIREEPDGRVAELIVVEPQPGESFRAARLANDGARRASGEYLAFLGEDVEITEGDWLEQLLLYLRLPGVGAAGPTLAYPDGRVAAAGYAIGLYDPAVPAMRGFPAESDGYYGSLSCAREVSAIGMDCLLIRRSSFERLGGFEETYSRQFHDLDLCLRLREFGLSTVCVPAPRTVSHITEARRRADFDALDRALFVDRWWELLESGDPYYNRGFSREAADYAPSSFGGDRLELAMREAAR
jgi:O-antigen biosynthesis protein